MEAQRFDNENSMIMKIIKKHEKIHAHIVHERSLTTMVSSKNSFCFFVEIFLTCY